MPAENDIRVRLDTFLADGHASEYFFSCGRFNDADPALLTCSSNAVAFDLSSLTKAFVAAPLLVSLEQQGLVDTNASLGQFDLIKEWPHLSNCKVSDILQHTSGLPAWRNFYVNCGVSKPSGLRPSMDVLKERFKTIAVDLRQHGKDVYSDVGMILLGACLSEHFKTSLGELFKEFVLERIGFDTEDKFGYRSQMQADLAYAPSGYCPLRQREISGEVQDENCWALGGVSLHAGLFAYGDRVERYLHCLWNSSLGEVLLKKNYALVKPGNASLFGWRQANDSVNAGFGGGAAMGHLGFTGTAFWVDFKQATFVILLTNRLIAGRDNAAIRRLRKQVFETAHSIVSGSHR